jgi:hypothetical protein
MPSAISGGMKRNAMQAKRDAMAAAMGLQSACGMPEERYGLERMPAYEGRDEVTQDLGWDTSSEEVTEEWDISSMFAPTLCLPSFVATRVACAVCGEDHPACDATRLVDVQARRVARAQIERARLVSRRV